MRRWWGIRHARWLWYWFTYLVFFNALGCKIWRWIAPGDWDYLQDVWDGRA